MMPNVLNTDLAGKVAVVTGAGGVLCSGFAKVLGRAGARVALLDLNYDAADRYAREATELWACSRPAAEFLFPAELLESRSWRFIPNGIDTRRFQFRPEVRTRVRQELGLGDSFVFGHGGRLCEQKNQAFLLEAFAKTAGRRPDSRLLLIGQGEDRSDLESRAEALNIADRVIFHGTSDRVPELLWAMDVFAFPSRFEGLGIVAVEAQAAGLPTVCAEAVPEEELEAIETEGAGETEAVNP